MKSFYSVLALVATTYALPQGVTQEIAPTASTPSGCDTSYSGSFEITTVNVTTASKRDLEQLRKRDVLTLKLSGGVLTDSESRTGYIAANYQFQFDKPPQTGAIYTAGWSVCANNTLALGGSAIFYQCLSGGFYNLYDRSWAAQCSPIYLEVIKGGGSVATQSSDGQPEATTAVSQLTDGQPQATTAASMLSEATDGQIQITTGAAVTQISDGQPQATSAGAVSQISDGQPQASSAAAPVTQISDGQPQATSAGAVSQISDGQPQASSAGAAPVSQISDGQPQAGTSTTAAPVTQISDGQIQATATNGTHTTATPVPYTGAAATIGSGAAGAFGLLAAAFALL